MKTSREVYIVGSKRTPFVKSLTKYKGVTTNELMTASLKALVSQFSLNDEIIGDVALGAVMNSSSNWNLTRECVMSSGLHPWTPGYNVQRACGTGLETVMHLALKISAGMIEEGIGGGVDTNSDLPLELSDSLRHHLLDLNTAKSFTERLGIIAQSRLKDLKPKRPAVVEPRTGLSMGDHTELMVKEWKVTREEQDHIAFLSHQTAEKAYLDGFYKDLVIEFKGLSKDATVRGDTSLEKLAKLKPAFDLSGNGTLTAGNSSPLTDGSSCVLVASETSMKKHGWTPLAKFVDAQAAAVDFVNGDGLLMAPTLAVGQMLKRNNLKLQDFDYYEIHEAFAGQLLCTLKAWESDIYCKKYLNSPALGSIDRSKMNLKGGSVALGHPFSGTGGRIVGSLSKMLSQKKGRGLISICTAGGMGVVAILESV